jgi:hypothetical protein
MNVRIVVLSFLVTGFGVHFSAAALPTAEDFWKAFKREGRKAVCQKADAGKGIYSFRSFKGGFCKVPLIGLLADKICAGYGEEGLIQGDEGELENDNFDGSQCAGYISQFKSDWKDFKEYMTSVPEKIRLQICADKLFKTSKLCQ